ncbi:DNA methyltransferase Dim-2 [Arachnomyces sp. PD_36]|nr:DNA methyltransferase Dim-2 [Arachnomyces sp. PD_36]
MPSISDADGLLRAGSTDQESFFSCDPPPSQGQSQSLAESGGEVPDFEDSVTPNDVCEKLVGVRVPGLSCPKSQYSSFTSRSERSAVEALQEANARDSDSEDESDFTAFDLDDFTIYRTGGGNHPHAMVSLQDVAAKQGASTFLFDGTLKVGDEHIYVQRVPFSLVSSGGYEDVTQHSIGLDLWIQSNYNRKKEGIWYRLLKPASEYARFHEAFLWLANLAKHLVDYISEHETRKVSLLQLKRDFYTWLQGHHKGDPDFERWIAQHNSKDFRQAVVAHGDYLYKQAIDINQMYSICQLWNEIGLNSPIVKEHPPKESQTVITPYVYECFKHMDWAHHLKTVPLDSEVKAKQRRRLEALNFKRKQKAPALKFSAGDGVKKASIPGGTVSPGDVIAVKRDTQTVWKGNLDDLWYAFVQHISESNNGRRTRLSVIWLYKPSDTVCANMVYPFKNELFMSDHCNCADAKIEASEVVRKVDVSFFSDGTNTKDFFIRQSYHSEGEVFMTLKKEDFCCGCRRSSNNASTPTSTSTPTYDVGDTVLVECITDNGMILEPAEVMSLNQGTGDVEIRELSRRKRDYKDPQRRPNELVYTKRFRDIHVDQIDRRCHVRVYTQEDLEAGLIPAPYSRDGNGDAFYIIVQEGEEKQLEPITQRSISFKQGFDPEHKEFQRLRALNIFSGGGTFDRGLEEGSAIQNEWAVEWGTMPMLTYRANHPEPEKLKLFCGSVNDYLAMAIRGKGKDKRNDHSVAQVGQPDFLSAGSPCQGYSMANTQKTSEGSLRNCSMIASVMGFVDLYRFKYGLLENVTAMANKSIKKNPLSQILCCLVGMGYQCRILNLDAWSFGAPQSRSRLFVSFAAPGLQLPDHPQLTHSHPQSVRNRSLGQAANGLPFGNRRWQTPVFDFVTAAKGTSDLPEVNPSIFCISKPDHRCSRGESFLNQTRMSSIPKTPRGQGLTHAIARRTLNESDLENLKNSKLALKGSKAWSRIHPHGLIPTVTTAVSASCRFTGRWLHWDEDRLMTVMEARRAQGYPDDEVLIGRAANQWKIVGNSVARQVAVALGLSLREACLINEKRRREPESNGELVAEINGDAILPETDDELVDEVRGNMEIEDPKPVQNGHKFDDKPVAPLMKQVQQTGTPRPSPPLNGETETLTIQRNLQISVAIRGSYDIASSRSTKSARTTATITEPSSRDEAAAPLTAIPSKRALDTQPLVISDSDEIDVISPSRKRVKRSKSSGGVSNDDPILLN